MYEFGHIAKFNDLRPSLRPRFFIVLHTITLRPSLRPKENISFLYANLPYALAYALTFTYFLLLCSLLKSYSLNP